jgi:hypothetical protein
VFYERAADPPSTSGTKYGTALISLIFNKIALPCSLWTSPKLRLDPARFRSVKGFAADNRSARRACRVANRRRNNSIAIDERNWLI